MMLDMFPHLDQIHSRPVNSLHYDHFARNVPILTSNVDLPPKVQSFSVLLAFANEFQPSCIGTRVSLPLQVRTSGNSGCTIAKVNYLVLLVLTAILIQKSPISPTWAQNATVHLPQSQNLNMATGGSSTVVNISMIFETTIWSFVDTSHLKLTTMIERKQQILSRVISIY